MVEPPRHFSIVSATLPQMVRDYAGRTIGVREDRAMGI